MEPVISNIEDDEIPILEYIKFLLKNKIIIIFFVIVGVIVAFYYNSRTHMYYQASTTFFIPSGNDASGSTPSIASLLGGKTGASGSVSGFMLMIIDTERLRNKIAMDFEHYYQTKDIDLIKSKLGLNALKISAGANGVYSLIFHSEDPKIILPVLDSTFKNLKLLNIELDILAQRDFYKILDPATRSYPVTEDKKKNFLIFGFGFFVAGVFFCLCIDFLKKNYKKIF